MLRLSSRSSHRPTTASSAITGYTVSYIDGGNSGSNWRLADRRHRPHNGKTYTCTVAATNGIGTGPLRSHRAPRSRDGARAPAPPTLSRGNAQISVAFTSPPADGGSTITGYTASCTSSDGGDPGRTPAARSPIVVSA